MSNLKNIKLLPLSTDLQGMGLGPEGWRGRGSGGVGRVGWVTECMPECRRDICVQGGCVYVCVGQSLVVGLQISHDHY